MANNPLDQFLVKKLITMDLYGLNISFTNSSAYMLIAGSIVLSYFYLALRPEQIIPSRLQVSAEIIYNMITGMLNQTVGQRGRRFIPLVFTLFMFILLCNLLWTSLIFDETSQFERFKLNQRTVVLDIRYDRCLKWKK